MSITSVDRLVLTMDLRLLVFHIVPPAVTSGSVKSVIRVKRRSSAVRVPSLTCRTAVRLDSLAVLLLGDGTIRLAVSVRSVAVPAIGTGWVPLDFRRVTDGSWRGPVTTEGFGGEIRIGGTICMAPSWRVTT